MQNKVHLLAPGVAERIAAGEVIERPASVVKELIENSLDAGATEISVSLENGGKELIEVLDNGQGMSPDDLELCIERHATSKLQEVEDLERISTLGFRGEALPSIAAVSDLTLISRTASAPSAYELTAGEVTGRFMQKPKPAPITFGQFIQSPHGTLIRARSLFSQIPARLKFLKSQGAEVSQVREWMERLAVAYPQVGFQLLSEGRSILNLRPETESIRIQTLLSDGNEYPLITVSNEQDGLRDRGLQVRIHWLQGLSSPHTRRLIQVVNRRAIRDRILQQALLASFRQALLPGQFPALALLIDIHPAALDVNVHPTKTEVRFLDSRKVFHTVETLAQNLISQMGSPARVPLNRSSFSPGTDRPTPSENKWVPAAWDFHKKSPPYSHQNTLAEFRQSLDSSGPPEPALNPGWKFSEANAVNPLPAHTPHPLSAARPVGSLFNTYFVYEEINDQVSELILVDQHAAHERVRYEKLRRKISSQTSPLASQALLLPEVIHFIPEDRPRLESRLPWLTRWGFETELFGEDALLFRAVPPEWGFRHLNVRLRNLTDRILHPDLSDIQAKNPLVLDEVLFEALASEACHSSVRAGDPMQPEERLELVRQLFECEHPWNCPHGRPTVVKIPERKLEEWFQRKI